MNAKLGIAPVARTRSQPLLRPLRLGDTASFLHAFHLEAKMIHTFRSPTRREDGEVYVTIGEVDRLHPLFLLTAGDLLHAERGLVEFRQFRRILSQDGNVSNFTHKKPSFVNDLHDNRI